MLNPLVERPFDTSLPGVKGPLLASQLHALFPSSRLVGDCEQRNVQLESRGGRSTTVTVWPAETDDANSTPRRTCWLPGEQDDGCDESKRCQGSDDRSTQPRLARLGAQAQKTLSHQGVGRQPSNEEGTACRSVIPDRDQHQE